LGQWEILHPAPSAQPWEVVESLENGPGKVVLWTDLDRSSVAVTRSAAGPSVSV